jgi:plastocyanin
MFRASFLLFAVTAILGYLAVSPPAVLAGGGGGGCHGETFTDAATTSVEVRNACLYPVVARVDPGSEVTWTIRDGAVHTITGANASWGTMDAVSALTSYRFDAPGVYPYYCVAHSWMAGAVVVGDGGAAAPSASGSVSAVNAPPPTAEGAAATREGGSGGGYFALGAGIAGVLGLIAGGAGFALGRGRA